jgi:hypothetical protein
MIGRAAGLLTITLALVCLAISCASGTSPFDKSYVAVVYGRVTRTGSPVAGLNVRGDVYTTTCPSSALQQTSSQSAQTDPDGHYRLLLTSTIQDAGQCLVLTVAGAPPVLHTLDNTPFSAEAPGPPADSVQLDASVP